MMIRKSVSLNTLLSLLVLLVPVVMLFFIPDGNNPFIDNGSLFVVFLMSIFLLLVIRVNQNLQIPMLNIFLLIYIFFWHFRFLTLTLFPFNELVMTRTVVINNEIFYFYTWVVFISLISAVTGIFLAYKYVISARQDLIKKNIIVSGRLNNTLKDKFLPIFFYCLMALGFLFYSTQLSENSNTFSLSILIGYFSLLFPFGLIMFLTVTPILNNEVSKKHKILFFVYILVYITISILVGSRSFLMYFILSGLFLAYIFNKSIVFKLWQLILAGVIGWLMIFIFAYGTYTRQIGSITGFVISKNSIDYALDSMSNISWDDLVGTAAARAGYLDFSAEMYANSKYSEIITAENIVTAVIDSLVPKALFNDNQLLKPKLLLEHRIREVYSSRQGGYHSDAIGAVGENYILFGYAFPVAIIFVSFVFTYLYYVASCSLFGFFIKYTLAFGLMTWWNSFGYDLLLINTGRQLIIGLLVIAGILSLKGVKKLPAYSAIRYS